MKASISKEDIGYFGFAFYWTWMSVTFFSPTLFGSSPNAGTVAQIAWLWMAGAASVLRLVHIVSCRLLPAISDKKFFVGAAFFASTIGAALLPLGSYMSGFALGGMPVLSITGAILCGMSSCWISIMWGEAYAGKNSEVSFVLISMTFILSCILHFGIVALPSPMAIVVTSLLNALSILAVLSMRFTSTSFQVSSLAKPKPKFSLLIILPLVAVFLYASCGEVLHTFLSLPGGADDLSSMGVWYTGGGGIGTAILLAVVLVVRRVMGKPQDGFSYLRVTLIGMAIAVMLPAFLPVSYLMAYAIFGAAFWCFRNIVWVYTTKVSTKLDIPPTLVFSLSQLMFSCAIAGGSPVVREIARSIHFGDMPWVNIALVMVFFILVVAVLISSGEKSLWGLLPPVVRESDSRTVESMFKKKYGLTSRECEFALLLSRGRSLPFIQERLYISEGTAKSHLRSIYRKLDVHTKQEFLDLVEVLEEKPAKDVSGSDALF